MRAERAWLAADTALSSASLRWSRRGGSAAAARAVALCARGGGGGGGGAPSTRTVLPPTISAGNETPRPLGARSRTARRRGRRPTLERPARRERAAWRRTASASTSAAATPVTRLSTTSGRQAASPVAGLRAGVAGARRAPRAGSVARPMAARVVGPRTHTLASTPGRPALARWLPEAHGAARAAASGRPRPARPAASGPTVIGRASRGASRAARAFPSHKVRGGAVAFGALARAGISSPRPCTSWGWTTASRRDAPPLRRGRLPRGTYGEQRGRGAAARVGGG